MYGDINRMWFDFMGVLFLLILVECYIFNFFFLQGEIDDEVELQFENLLLLFDDDDNIMDESGILQMNNLLVLSNIFIRFIIIFVMIWKIMYNLLDVEVIVLFCFFKRFLDLKVRLIQSKVFKYLLSVFL